VEGGLDRGGVVGPPVAGRAEDLGVVRVCGRPPRRGGGWNAHGGGGGGRPGQGLSAAAAAGAGPGGPRVVCSPLEDRGFCCSDRVPRGRAPVSGRRLGRYCRAGGRTGRSGTGSRLGSCRGGRTDRAQKHSASWGRTGPSSSPARL